MTATIIEEEDEICELKKEIKCIIKQINEVESMLWALDEQHKEYHNIRHVQMRQDSMYLCICVLLNLVYLWWITS